MRRPTPLSPAQICKNAERIAVLEGIVDSTNMGAIIRSAAALGMDGILLTKTCCDPLLRRAVRVSMGTVFQIPWAYFDDDCTDWQLYLKQFGFKTAAMALNDNAISIDDPDLAEEEKLAIVLGTEGDGLASQTIENCDYNVIIPMYHHVDSLNVAAASAVAFWQLRRK
jgi:tRNA G18 (ribose-2'-O)-methylase SpoU